MRRFATVPSPTPVGARTRRPTGIQPPQPVEAPSGMGDLQALLGNRGVARFVRGLGAPATGPARRAATVQRFGAGTHGHGGIESDAAGDPSVQQSDPRREQGVRQIYSGNFMRDMNQLNVPLIVNTLAAIPRDPVGAASGPAIGTRGAHDITTAVIQALAILELGPEVADSLVTGGGDLHGTPTPDRIGAYRPEEHIDNPMGTGAADLVVTNTTPGAVDAHGSAIEVGEPRVALATNDGAGAAVTDPDRDSQLRGSAIPGAQVENPALYTVSPGGLQNHIFNSAEAVKGRWSRAASLGPTGPGRSEFGAGLHAVEDFFSHSNFIEVSLNSYIGEAMSLAATDQRRTFADAVVDQNRTDQAANHSTNGRTAQGLFVDTLYDASVPSPGSVDRGPAGAGRQRQAVTTGTFGGLDTKVSISHILVPELPRLQSALLGSVDRLFGIAKSGEPSGWDRMRAMLSTEPAGAAGARVLEGFANAGVVIPVPDISLTWRHLDLTPGLIGPPVSVEVPTGIAELTSNVPITDAAAEYGRIYHKVQGFNEIVQQVRQAVVHLPRQIAAPVIDVIHRLQSFEQRLEQQVRQRIKREVVAGLVSIVDAVSGRTQQQANEQRERRGQRDGSDEDLNRDLGDALSHLHEGLEAMESRTSIESRLAHGDLSELPRSRVEAMVGPVTVVGVTTTEVDGKPVVRTHYAAVNPLPPSHSEVAKDHEPHSEHQGGLVRHESGEPDLEEGSPFFGLARALAVEADRHCYAAMQVVWDASGAGDTSLFGDGQRYRYSNDSDRDGGRQRHEEVMDEARGRSAQEHRAAVDEHRQHQSAEGPLGDLLSTVDLFLAHPDDSQWWRPVLDGYVQSHREDVLRSILRRNRTRAARV